VNRFAIVPDGVGDDVVEDSVSQAAFLGAVEEVHDARFVSACQVVQRLYARREKLLACSLS
jgi:hypothetical protein